MSAEIQKEIDYRNGKTTFLINKEGKTYKVSSWPKGHDLELTHVCGKVPSYMTFVYVESFVDRDNKPHYKELARIESRSKERAYIRHEGIVGQIQRTGGFKHEGA